MENYATPHFPTHILNYISSEEMIGIRAGKKHETFIEIWMVTIGERVFARSWRLSERSWFTTFMKIPLGDICCLGEIIPVTALIVGNQDTLLTAAINQAYNRKYNHGDDSYYVNQMIDPTRWERTIELRPRQLVYC
ncbi:DUF2255 family protein [Chitinophaga silvatica]|nr:DUF2255 family protein [Chitinophaga silvatica]